MRASRLCGYDGTCSTPVESGRCPAHRRAADRQRETREARGYDRPWRELTHAFRQMLINAGVVPVCGARLPGAPVTHDSACAAAGLLVDDSQHRRRTGKSLHTDHIVPHSGDDRLRLNPLNLQLLCKSDHDAKTRREQARA